MNEKLIAKDTYKVRVRRISRADFLLFCIAPLFIFNPEMAVMDILPDFIGYILILIPLFKLRDVNERFEDAKKQITVALVVNLGKYAALLLSFGAIGQKEGGSASSLMMFSLVFAVLDIIFVTSAFRTFFDALHKLGEKYGSDAVTGYKTKKHKGKLVRARKNRTQRMSSSTCIFVVVRALCYAIPEFATGSSHAYDDTAFDWSDFIYLFRMLGVLVALVYGIAWFVRATAYFARLSRDREFILAVNKDYTDNAQSYRIRYILRNTATFSLAASVALFLCPDVYLYDKSVNILPDLIPAAVLALAFFASRSLFVTNKKLTLRFAIPTAVWGISTAVKDLLRYFYFSKYTMQMYERDPDAYGLYNIFRAVCVLDAAAFCAVVLSLCAIIDYVNNEYAVSKLSRENESVLRIKDAERKEFSRSCVTPVRWLAFVSAACSAAYPFVLPLTTLRVPDTAEKYKSIEYMTVNFAASYWFVDLVVVLVLAVLVRRAFSALNDRTENNLMLE